MVADEITAKGGLLGRRLELNLEDSATHDAVAAAKARGGCAATHANA